jgi:hypothetical protein
MTNFCRLVMPITKDCSKATGMARPKYHFSFMNRSTHERFSQRLKGGLFLLAIVFGVLMLSGGPDISSADSEEALKSIVVDPTSRAWNAY